MNHIVAETRTPRGAIVRTTAQMKSYRDMPQRFRVETFWNQGEDHVGSSVMGGHEHWFDTYLRAMCEHGIQLAEAKACP